jgi:predicted TIM-barrel fold metal-dependent hydrolase
MSYANGRRLLDADSHIMELPDYLVQFADPSMRERLPRLMGGPLAKQLAQLEQAKAHPPERVAEMRGLGDSLLTGPKNYLALGAFNTAERTQALDQLGFERQLVFPTFSAAAAFFAKDIDVRYATARAANRAMAAFCEGDPRLWGVAVLPTDDTQRALAELEQLIQLGLKAAWVPHSAAGERSPGHGALDPLWARMAEAGIAFALHVGGNHIQLPPRWMNNGRPIAPDWLGSAENIRGKDMLALHHEVEKWIGCLVLDGVFDRHPKLRGAVTELGAAYVPTMLERLDYCLHGWKKSDPELAKLQMKPSEAIVSHMAFTPYPHENVGQLIALSDPRLYMFSSDYPHIEGGRTPVERFDSHLDAAATPSAARDRFYFDNFAQLFAAAH